jgi:hypothetical protein
MPAIAAEIASAGRVGDAAPADLTGIAAALASDTVAPRPAPPTQIPTTRARDGGVAAENAAFCLAFDRLPQEPIYPDRLRWIRRSLLGVCAVLTALAIATSLNEGAGLTPLIWLLWIAWIGVAIIGVMLRSRWERRDEAVTDSRWEERAARLKAIAGMVVARIQEEMRKSRRNRNAR